MHSISDLIPALRSGDPWACQELFNLEAGWSYRDLFLLATTPHSVCKDQVYPRILGSMHKPGWSDWLKILELLRSQDPSTEIIAATVAALEGAWPKSYRILSEPWIETFFKDPKHPVLEIFTALDFSIVESNYGLRELAATPALGKIKQLAFKVCDYREEYWEILASGSIESLTHLSLCGTPDMMCLPLLKSPKLSELRFLDLASCNLRDDAFIELIEQDHLQELKHLDLGMDPDLGSNYLTGKSVKALASSKLLSSLEHLFLCSNEIEPDLLEPLLSSEKISQLRSLSIDGSPLLEERFDMLLSSKLESIEHLSMMETNLDEQRMRRLLEKPWVKGLRLLGISALPEDIPMLRGLLDEVAPECYLRWSEHYE